jgi:uncharacterized membrane protein
MNSNLKPAPSTDHLIIALITLTAFSFRLAGYDSEPYWTDEIYSLVEANFPLAELFSPRWLKAGQMPLYFVLLKFWQSLVGSDRLLLLLPNMILGSLCVPLTWAIARRIPQAKRLGPLVAAGMVALSPLQIHHCQELRMYPLVVLLALVSVFAYLKSFTRPRASIILAFSCLALGLTHGAGTLLIAAMGLCLLLVRPQGAKYFFSQIAALAAAGLPLLVLIAITGDFSSTKAMTTGDELNVFHGLLMFLLFSGPGYAAGIGFDPLRFVHPETLVGSAFVLLLFLVGFIKLIRNSDRTLALLVLLLLGVYILVASRHSFINQPKYILYYYPLLYCIAAATFDAIPRRPLAVALASVAIPLWLSVIVLRLQIHDFPQYRKAANYVTTKSTDREKVYLFHNNEFNPFAYYYRKNNLIPPGSIAQRPGQPGDPRRKFTNDFGQYFADVEGVWYIKSTEYDETDRNRKNKSPQFMEMFYRAGETETETERLLSEYYTTESNMSLFKIDIIHYSGKVTDTGE